MLIAFAFTALAGAATALGGLAAVHHRLRSDAGLAAALGFAAGAMLLVSAVEIIPKGADGLASAFGSRSAWGTTLLLVAAGSGITAGLQRWAGGRQRGETHAHGPGAERQRLLRSGVVVALAVSAHNLPEGLATFVATVDDPAAGATVALAIALHNVPEGIAVAAPLHGAGVGRGRAVAAAALSGLAEPVGAVLGYLLLIALLPAAAHALVFGLVAGVMLHIAVTELLPSACRLATVRTAAMSSTAGAGTMALSLGLLGLA
ncbi:ZIP family metal transporter [Nocardioides alcanivorans]|uniref:ZIP family metal transporter n=1 Tax=Nocardioides alcanivorans TaxID=2897352 RepID=UPI001F25E04B|nr:ZIP family metal transporter [Nocardioides alcanivorans]